MNKLYTNNLISYVLFLLCIFTSIKTVAQHDDGPAKPSTAPNIVPSPPNSASLGLYGQVPLNQFTGNGSINIPLHSIKNGNLELPISLSYSSDGIKVDQYESNVGMGWALNAGGVITRQVYDYQDSYNGRLQKPNVPLNSPVMYNFLEQATSAPEVDTQPDIYNYNFGGLSGKFYLDDNNVPVEIEPSGLKFEVTSNFLELGTGISGPNRQPEIIITDTKGVKYFFGGGGGLETSLVRDLNLQGTRSEAIKTSWYLTKILDTMTNNVITLNYEVNYVEYLSGIDQTLEYKESNSYPQISLTTAKYNSSSSESILKEIISNDSRVTFSYSKRFTDNNFDFVKMDEINIYDNQNTLINKIGLNYVEYSGNSFSNYSYLPENIRNSPDYIKKRFYLNQITEHSNVSNSKIHKFEYYSPENLPARFSFAKDNYGVFNGKDNSTLISNEVPVPTYILHPVYNSFYTELANRKPDHNFGYFGLLKKITYPTKGSTTLVYEPHVGQKVTVPVYPASSNVNLTLFTAFGERSNSITKQLFSSYGQKIKLNTLSSINSACAEPDPHDPQATIYITDVATNTKIEFFNHENIGYETSLGFFYAFNPDSNLSDSVTFTLEANKSYIVTLEVTTPCVMANIGFNYYSDPITYQDVEPEIGGMRLSKTTKDNLLNGKVETEKYLYHGGTYISRAPIAYVRKTERYNTCESLTSVIRFSVSSSCLARIYSMQNVQYGYNVVNKSYGENFENGGEEFVYDITQDAMPYIVQGEEDKTTPFTNGFGAGRLLNHKAFKINSFGQHIILQETINEYKHDASKDKFVTGRLAYRSFEFYHWPAGLDNTVDCFPWNSPTLYSLNEYFVRSQWSYLNKTTQKDYDINGENPIIKETTYEYTNPLHCQPTSIVSKNSKGDTLKTKYSYAHESLTTVQGPQMQKLIDQNRIESPIKTQTFVNNVKTSESITKYEESTATSNLLLPKSVYANKLSTDIDISLDTDKKVTFDKYDDIGNVLQYTPEGGLPVAIIWGYNKTQPIAKVENATYDQAIAAYSSNENTFRSSLPNAMITTYTYKPLVGISTIRDPKGYTTTYTYDDLNRQQFVKDNDGKILSENQYHYKN
ncbi:RHS repeat protein [Flavobacterium sp. ANB]|uniref:RHS repeat protein n=1 Tax=unclassified Flavobacterium TaxID=196869 RepID=UPI0012B965C7|nr:MULTISPECIES: RHS repeat protein [unclassified Flavobacterium]MBF4518715.1 RHS repeat protein [Flavobacterium sp. ANB]MTD67780.1 hypothetical protein [Flavobacterium sp. LC2016-13]